MRMCLDPRSEAATWSEHEHSYLGPRSKSVSLGFEEVTRGTLYLDPHGRRRCPHCKPMDGSTRGACHRSSNLRCGRGSRSSHRHLYLAWLRLLLTSAPRTCGDHSGLAVATRGRTRGHGCCARRGDARTFPYRDGSWASGWLATGKTLTGCWPSSHPVHQERQSSRQEQGSAWRKLRDRSVRVSRTCIGPTSRLTTPIRIRLRQAAAASGVDIALRGLRNLQTTLTS